VWFGIYQGRSCKDFNREIAEVASTKRFGCKQDVWMSTPIHIKPDREEKQDIGCSVRLVMICGVQVMPQLMRVRFRLLAATSRTSMP